MRFYTKQQAFNQRRHSWACLECGSIYGEKVDGCGMCGTAGRIHYFPSMGELKRYQTLRLLERTGDVTGLELQPVYPISINGIKVCEYRADFSYKLNGELVVEDVKGTLNEKHHADLFKLKRKLVEAQYGIEIKITKG